MLSLWIAPTEHDLQTYLRTSQHPWRISSLPEQHGCDIMVPTPNGIVGFQRKTLPDLATSLQDGRLYYEFSQIQSSATLQYAFLLLESGFVTTTDGLHYTDTNLSVGTLRSLIAKAHALGVGYLPTNSPSDTLTACLGVSRYLSSDNHALLHRPKQVRNEWGFSTSETYGTFLLQSFPGIGPKVAAAIYKHFGGVPLVWTVSADELARVPGIGKVRAQNLLEALRSPVPAAAGPDDPAAPESA